ncbi:MAG: helix-hairpin-helix domain-containing protein [bacterium]|nr:helix-hairpin-helix domain-containing protein [bacterium]
MEFLIRRKKEVIVGLVFLLVLGFGGFYYFGNKKSVDELSVVSDDVDASKEETKNIETDKIFVDVKGAVKKPGVYELNEGDKVVDAINKAEGLTKSAVTTNINLAKKVTNEMVVYVFTKKELSKSEEAKTVVSEVPCVCETVEVNNCVKEDNSSVTNDNQNSEFKKVNINTASAEELVTIKGLGESKANAIISYRNTNGNFKSIEDVKNVSGIGDALFNKIKELITV